MAGNFFEVKSPEQFKELLSADLKRISIINFWASWAEPCRQMNELVKELAKKYHAALFLQVCNPIQVFKSKSHELYWRNQVEAEEQSDIAELFDIEAVPSVVILQVCASIRLWKTIPSKLFGEIIGSYSLASYIRRRCWCAYTGRATPPAYTNPCAIGIPHFSLVCMI